MVNSAIIILVISAVTATRGAPIEDEDDWTNFKKQYNKTYATKKDENYRKGVFHDNQKFIELHNKKYDLGEYSYKLKINQFGDTVYVPDTDAGETLKLKRKIRYKEFYEDQNNELPDSIDWREKGAVTEVRDQGMSCGSCWAFSAAGALEGQYFLKTGVLTTLSVQRLIDCTTEYGNLGCDGGSSALAFQYVMDQKGLIEPESNYTYEGKDTMCPYKGKSMYKRLFNRVAKSFVYIEEGDEDALKVAVATMGPISIAMDASHETFRFYSEGIYYQPACNDTVLDHGVLLVGYGTDNSSTDPENRDYWLIKNSWAESWGEAGYFRIPRNRQNHCGIASAALYPLLYEEKTSWFKRLRTKLKNKVKSIFYRTKS